MMIPQSCIKVETDKFPILEGEEEELINEGMYGKALGIYLQSSLPDLGVRTHLLICQDWGWWLDVESEDLEMGLCIYCDPDSHGHPTAYGILPSIQSFQRWSWKKFRFIDCPKSVMTIMNKVASLFESDPEVTAVSRHDDYMF